MGGRTESVRSGCSCQSDYDHCGKEQIVSQKALEQARKAQEESGKSFPKKGKDGKYTYYMHNNPSEDISDPNYKSDGTKKSGGRIVEIVPGKGVVREGGSGIEKEDAAKGSETSAAENAQQAQLPSLMKAVPRQ